MKGVVYTETVVHTAPSALAAEAPYQIAIVDLANGTRITGRMTAPLSENRVTIGETVELVEERAGVPILRAARNIT